MSTRVDGATVLVLASARATLSAGPVHMTLSASERTHWPPSLPRNPNLP
jgi:hypothetical protein